MKCSVCSSKVTGFPSEVCGHDARTRPAPPKAQPDREGVPIPAGVLGQRRGLIPIPEYLLNAPPFDHAYQGGLHRWPLDLDSPAALHGKEPCRE